MITLFSISITNTSGHIERNLTDSKIEAQKIVFDCLMKEEVEFSFSKFKVTKEVYESEYNIIKKRADLRAIGLA